MSERLGENLRAVVLGINSKVFRLHRSERLRWTMQAVSVLVASALGTLGMYHLLHQATQNQVVSFLVGVCFGLAVFAIDRYFTGPKASYKLVDQNLTPPEPVDSSGLLFGRLILTVVVGAVSGSGIGILANSTDALQQVRLEAQGLALEKARQQLADFATSLDADRVRYVHSLCNAESWQTNDPNERRQREGGINLAERALGDFDSGNILPLMQLLAGSGALDRIPSLPKQEPTFSTPCPRAEANKTDPLTQIRPSTIPILPADGSRESARDIGKFAPSEPQVDALLREGREYFNEVREDINDLDAKKEGRKGQPDLIWLNDDLTLKALNDRYNASNRVTRVVSEWKMSIDPGTIEKTIGLKQALELLYVRKNWYIIVAGYVLVLFFDTLPLAVKWLSAKHLNPRGYEEEIGFREFLDSESAREARRILHDRTTAGLLSTTPTSVVDAGIKATFDREADRQFENHDPKAFPRRGVLKLAGTGSAMALTAAGGLAWCEGPATGTAGLAFIRELSKNMLWSGVQQFVSDSTGFDPEKFGSWLSAQVRSDSDLSPNMAKVAYYELDGGRQQLQASRPLPPQGVIGVPSRDGTQCYACAVDFPGSTNGIVVDGDFTLVAPHWLHVLDAFGKRISSELLLTSQASAGAFVTPIDWDDGAKGVPSYRSGTLSGGWESPLGRVNAALKFTPPRLPSGTPEGRLRQVDGSAAGSFLPDEDKIALALEASLDEVQGLVALLKRISIHVRLPVLVMT